MSIFINSKVHLPSSCEKCPFNYADMSAGVCTAADKTIDTRTYGRKRHPDCPMVELPTPHGRLIDADRLLAVLKSMASTSKNVLTEAVIGLIDNQPVIVEKERNE